MPLAFVARATQRATSLAGWPTVRVSPAVKRAKVCTTSTKEKMEEDVVKRTVAAAAGR